MIVISIMNSKGGVGKTLISLILCQYLHEDNKVCLLDIDSTKQGYGFVERRKNDFSLDMPWEYKHTTDKGEIVDIIDNAQDNDTFDVMIIDTPGHINELNIDVLARSDLTLIPMLSDAGTIDLARSTQGLVVRASRTIGRPIPYAFVFTRIKAVPIDFDFLEMIGDMRENDIPHIPTILHERQPFKSMIKGLMLKEMTVKIGGKPLHGQKSVKDAHAEAIAFTADIIEFINQ